MAYFDGFDDQPLTPDQEAENRRRMLGMLAGAGRTSVLGAPPAPTVPSPRVMPATPPAFDAPKTTQPVLGQPTPPVRPNVMPQRTDFPAKPVPTWQKVLGVAAAPFLPAVTGALLGGPRREAERQYQSATQEWERGQADEERQARIRNINSEIQARANPKPEGLTQEEAQAVEDLVAQGVKRVDAIGQVKAAGQKPQNQTFEEQSFAEWLKTHPGGTRMQFEKERATVTQKPERPQPPQRMLGVTPDNKVVELTPGMSLPPGTKSLGGELSLTAKTEQGEEAGKSATAYANDYLAGKQWTGPGDEALMEKFFEMAKPSSGFRMTQAQIEILQRSRDFMGSVTAKAKHLFTPEAPWFSDTQRQQIVKTMNDLAKSRSEVKLGTQDQPVELERGPDGKLRPKNATRQ